MAYSGFISDPNYCRTNQDETVNGKWVFNGSVVMNGSLNVNGSATFDKTIQGTALNAMWGDLAEVYECDIHEVLVPGTLVKFGGKYEITKTLPNDKKCFGVISTNPGVILNKKETKGEKVALVGRVPCRIIGKIFKFDKLTTSKIPGVAKRKTLLDILLFKPTIGISLHTDTTDCEKMVEIFVRADK